MLDVRGLEPPEPLEQILEALSQLASDQHLCVLIDREPHPLYRILDANEFSRATCPGPDFCYEIVIRHRDGA